MQLKALLFDVDGTLADTEPQGHLPAYNQAFKDLGLSWNWSAELYRRELLLLPGGRERIRHFLLRHRPPLGAHADIAERDLDGFVNQIHAAKSRRFRRLVESGQVTLRPGVRRLIEDADVQGLKLALVTNASERSLKPFLNYTLGQDLLDRFDFIVSGEQVENKKPAPDLYLRAMERLDLKADHCLAIEDSAMGLCAAAAAGLNVLVTVNDDTREQDFEVATAVVSGLGEPEKPWSIIVDQGRLTGADYASPQVLNKLLGAAPLKLASCG